MPTNLNEKSLEDLIVGYLVRQHHYEQGVSADYDPTYAIDEKRLRQFLEDTQPDKVAASRIFDTDVDRRRFLERLRKEITARGIVDVLRKGVKHRSYTFYLYSPYPTDLSVTAVAEYRKNKFCVIRQLFYSGDNNNSVDVVLFLNGLPLITMELKNQLTCQDTAHAVAQYRNDRDPKDLLFMPKRCAVHFAVDDETVEMCTKLCGKDSWFLPFNKGVNDGAGNPVNPNGLKTAYLWEDILSKRSLSDIIEHYAQVVVEKDEDTGKRKEKIIWPRWHQLEAVRMLLKDTKQKAVGERYLIQHSAGSGKSNTITWLAYQLVGMMEDGKYKFDSIIIVTDRVNLDKQLRDNVKAFMQNENIVDWANTSDMLRRHLESGKKIILTTVHKFSFILNSVGSDLAEKHFAVIIDEAHSSQSGKMSGKGNMVLSGQAPTDIDADDEDAVNEAVDKYIKGRKMAPNANFYAFTATPKNRTEEVFGVPYIKDNGETAHRPFHVYTMKQAIDEGFILDVLRNYTTYKSYYRIRKAVEDDPEYDRDQAMKKLHYFVESQPETVAEKAKVMVEHFHTSVAQKIGGEARCMIVTTGIGRAIDYFYAVNSLLKERGSQYKAIVAFSGEYDYHGAKVDEQRLNGFPSSKIEKTFRTGMYRFLIVADKFQTGYDEPLLHTMYVDKPLHDLQAVQTLSRLNRTMPGKHETSVLDFVNTADDIQAAFQPYYKTTLLSSETDPNKLNDLLATIEGYDIYTEEEIDDFVRRYWAKAPRTELDPILDTMKERFMALDKDDQVKCKSAIKTYIRTYEFLSTIMPDGSREWEKKEEVLVWLVRKLPSLGMDDLTEGLLDAVDFDRYRQEKVDERDIQLENTDTEIPPVPTSINDVAAEPDMEHLSVIEQLFNDLFGNTNWKDSDIVRHQLYTVVENVKQDDTVVNSMLNSDEETAHQDSDESVQANMSNVTDASTELMTRYWQDTTLRQKVNQWVYEQVREQVNPRYDENALKEKLNEAFRQDFADFCDGEHEVSFSEVLDIFFRLVNVDTIPDLQGLRTILRRTLNCLYRAQHREEDYRTWYSDLVSRFEAFLKKIYWVEHGERMPLNAEGHEPALRETVSYFPRVEALYSTQNPKLERFKQYYRNVYSWRNNENHRAIDIPADLLPTCLHAAVAMYLFATMVSAGELKEKI